MHGKHKVTSSAPSVGSDPTSQLQDSQFHPKLRFLSVWAFTCSPCVCVGVLQVILFIHSLKNMPVGAVDRLNFP